MIIPRRKQQKTVFVHIYILLTQLVFSNKFSSLNCCNCKHMNEIREKIILFSHYSFLIDLTAQNCDSKSKKEKM